MVRSAFTPKAQSIIEYAIILSVVVAAILTMRVYAQRGIQAAIKVSADELGSQKASEDSADYGVTGLTQTNVKSTASYDTQMDKGGAQTTGVNSATTYSGTSTTAQYDKKD